MARTRIFTQAKMKEKRSCFKLLQGTYRCKKDRWDGTCSDNPGNAIKKTFGKRVAMPLDFDVFKHPVYPYGLKEDFFC